MQQVFWIETTSFCMQVKTELKKKLCSWRREAKAACCGQWLAVFGSQRDAVSIAMVPEHKRSSATSTGQLSPGSPNPDSSFIHRPTQMLPLASQQDLSLLHCPVVGDQDNIQQRGIPLEDRQSAAEMQVALVIHLQDPVELLPNAVSDWRFYAICMQCEVTDTMLGKKTS